jgi:hypothetical protein
VSCTQRADPTTLLPTTTTHHHTRLFQHNSTYALFHTHTAMVGRLWCVPQVTWLGDVNDVKEHELYVRGQVAEELVCPSCSITEQLGWLGEHTWWQWPLPLN